jgi:thioredoxin 1
MEKLTKIESYEQLNEILEKEEFVVLYFSSKDCSICRAMKPKFDECLLEYQDVGLYDIELDSFPLLRGEYSIFAAPTVVFMHEKKEIFRESRMININHFLERMERFMKMAREV